MEIDLAKEFNSEIKEIVDVQVNENREAIFFIYEDLSTTDIYKGEATHISLTKDEEVKVMSRGNILASVHTHPSGFDLSTIDIMTGLATNQRYMSVATPLYNMDTDSDFVLTTIDMSEMRFDERLRMLKSMRRSSTGITEFGRQIRKQVNLQRFNISGYRTHEVEVEGITLPIYERPSVFEVEIGEESSVTETAGYNKFIE